LVAQNRPDFSGAWIDASAGGVLTVKHDGTALTFKYEPFSQVVVNMDGTQTVMPLPDGNVLLVKAAWQGSRLVVTYYLPEAKQDIRRQTWQMAGDGQLVIETEFFGPAMGGPGLKQSPPTKDVFKRR
jgi:hypothetical protein